MPERKEDMSSYSEGQTHLLMDALEAAGYTATDITLLGQAGNRLNDIRFFLWGQAKIVQIQAGLIDPTIDPIICVDRSVKPSYPEWVKELLHPELEVTGPAEYNIAKVEQWLHDGQKGGNWIKGQKIYEHLKNNNMLESCLGFADLLAIKAKGITFFRRHFAGKAPFGLKSAVRSRDGYLRAPCLCENGEQVLLLWRWLGCGWYDSRPALRFAS